MRSIAIRKVPWAVCLVCTAACGGATVGGGTTSTQPVTLEMDVPTPASLRAIQEVVTLHEKNHPNVTVNVVSLPSEATILSRFAAGDPPQAFQANLGEDALQFANDALDLSTADWASDFNEGVLLPLTQNGKLVGVPLSVTRQNVAYWNVRVLTTLPAPLNAIPRGVDAFKAWITGVAAAGYTHPLCFGFKDGWVNAHILFEDIVPAIAGAAYSAQYWSGKDPNGASSAQMATALDFATQYVFPYLTSDTPVMGMADGIDRVMNASMPDKSQTCIMTAMGDWGGTQLESAPESYEAGPGKDFDASGWPGAEDLDDYGGDAMIAAVGTQNQADVLALFQTLASEEGQLLFAVSAGEIPARNLTSADQAQLPYLVQVDLTARGSLPGFKVIAKSNYDFNTLYTVAQNFFVSGDKTALLAFLAQNYASLQ